MNLRSWLFLISILSVTGSNVASAYLVLGPKLTIVVSPDGSALLRIDPGTSGPKPGEAGQPAQATVFRYDPAAKIYRVTTTFALRNPLAPMTAIISDRAEFIVTCDDWDPDIGCTSNVVVVYRGSGEMVKAWSLEDIFSPAEIKRFGPFASNVPLRRWRGEKIAFAPLPEGPSVWISAGKNLPWHVDLRLRLHSLTFEKHPVSQSDK